MLLRSSNEERAQPRTSTKRTTEAIKMKNSSICTRPPPRFSSNVITKATSSGKKLLLIAQLVGGSGLSDPICSVVNKKDTPDGVQKILHMADVLSLEFG
jgi:hypothetical protein